MVSSRSSKTQSTSPKKSHPFRQWRQRLATVPSLPSEDSIALRILVQSLVTVGICAMAVASADVTETSNWNLLAIPLSAAGAYWSWRSRRRANVGVKFCIAMGMLVALVLFFGRLLNNPGDTRIVLAELLIQLQVLHSFDLPRRKDLGYSMMIGLVLIGVAATISQTLLFGPLLFLFLLIALPVLVLDYRSRLGLLSQSWRSIYTGTSPKKLGGVMLVVVLLGLLIFAALPRLPGYQLRTFPVNGSVDTDASFDGRTILNPGYVGDGRGDGPEAEGGSGGSGSPESGPGAISTDFYYGFNQRMNQNLRGEMIPKVVMRVRSQAEGFWRVMAFDRYTGQGWEVSRNDATSTLQRSRSSYQFWPLRVPRLGPSREVVQTYTMVSDFQNLIPALYEPKQVYFPAERIAVDPEGAMRAPKALIEGITYTVISDVSLRVPSLLREVEGDYPSNIEKYYLQVPAELQERVRRETERLLATAPLPLTNDYDKAVFLTDVLKQRYSLEEDLPFFADDEDLVEAFLFKYQGGTADHFSTVLTIMLRSVGIPARLAAGFGPGQFNPFTGFYIVRNTDAYAVTEVFFPKYGWFNFDPIPGHLFEPPSEGVGSPFRVLRQIWEWLQGQLPAPAVELIQAGLRLIGRLLEIAIGALLRLRGWLRLLAFAIAATAIGFATWLGQQLWRKWQHRRWLTQLSPVEKVYQQMLQRLAAQGYAKPAAQTPFEYVEQLRESAFARLAPVEAIINAYVSWRYGGKAADISWLRSQLEQLARRSPSSVS
ncbi:MAG: DUF3488 domain-containing protein [Leptolyngbya sp. SIO4C1]|nr:DUF3488 domain-containing protein [Leptolyngbya sp. SIO4C1]